VVEGQAQLCHAQVPELARLARRWELLSLQEALATVVASEEGGLTPEAPWEFPWEFPSFFHRKSI